MDEYLKKISDEDLKQAVKDVFEVMGSGEAPKGEAEKVRKNLAEFTGDDIYANEIYKTFIFTEAARRFSQT